MNDLVERVDRSLERLDRDLRELRGDMRELRSEVSALRRDGMLATAALVAAIIGTGILT